MARKFQTSTWEDFPVRKEADGWHCRKCGLLLTGRKRSWCGKKCLKEVLLTVHWRYIRACILRRDKYKCVLCAKRASEVDHIVEMVDGGSFHEWSNLRAICRACHKAKTLLSRRARVKKKVQKTVLVDDGPTGPKGFYGS
jgi:hypothetical protein